LHASNGSECREPAMDRAGIDRACNFKLGHYRMGSAHNGIASGLDRNSDLTFGPELVLAIAAA